MCHLSLILARNEEELPDGNMGEQGTSNGLLTKQYIRDRLSTMVHSGGGAVIEMDGKLFFDSSVTLLKRQKSNEAKVADSKKVKKRQIFQPVIDIDVD